MTMYNPDGHWRRADVTRVVDGDTIDVRLDMGWHLTMCIRLRLINVDTPELRPRKKGRTPDDLADEIDRAKSAKRYVEWWVETYGGNWTEWPFVVRSEKLDSFGRSLGDIAPASAERLFTRPKYDWLSDALLEEGHAQPS